MANAYDKALAAFEAEDSELRVKERKGDCPECGGAKTVEAVERMKHKTVVVDGACTECDFTFSRAGYTEANREEAE